MRQPWLLALLAASVAFLALWVLWKVGRMLLRLVLGLAVVSLVGLLLWYLLHR
ncbi:MAG: hypothetical protein U0P81_01655 [Holophagaceae bacterium]